METTTALAQHNKTDENGRPSVLQTAVMLYAFSDMFQLAKPSYVVQKVIFGLLMPFSYLFGFRPTYQKYLD